MPISSLLTVPAAPNVACWLHGEQWGHSGDLRFGLHCPECARDRETAEEEGRCVADSERARVVGRLRIHTYRCPTTGSRFFEGWEPFAGHWAWVEHGGHRFGRLGTRPLPEEIEELPPGDERDAGLQRHLAMQALALAEALATIFPEDPCLLGLEVNLDAAVATVREM